MSVLTNTTGSADCTPDMPELAIWRLSVEQYHAMTRAGILTEDDPVELLDGWLVTKIVKNPPHRIATRRVRQALERVAGCGWYVDSQEPITLATSEPEPDAVVVRGTSDDYADRHPGPREVALVVEVSGDTLSRDQTFKKRVYAEAGIPIYWIVNLVEGKLEVYTAPTGAASNADYHHRRDYARCEEVPLVLDGREIARLAIGDLLPPQQHR
jgi:Uma2 family endonuclease